MSFVTSCKERVELYYAVSNHSKSFRSVWVGKIFGIPRLYMILTIWLRKLTIKHIIWALLGPIYCLSDPYSVQKVFQYTKMIIGTLGTHYLQSCKKKVPSKISYFLMQENLNKVCSKGQNGWHLLNLLELHSFLVVFQDLKSFFLWLFKCFLALFGIFIRRFSILFI